jgi:2-alkenal reductase
MEKKNRRSGNGVLLLLVGLGTLLTFAYAFLFLVGAVMVLMTPVTANRQPDPAVVDMVSVHAEQRPVLPQAVVVATPEGGRDYESAVLANLYKQVNASVVNVTALGEGGSVFPEGFTPPDGFDSDDLFSFSSGSGFVWDAEGHIVTNSHVVEGADQVQVTFSDRTVSIAEVVGTDVDSDLAVLRVTSTGYSLIPVRLGKMDDVFVGMRVAAIGNPFGLEGTVTSGIVSALGRSIPARAGFSIPGSIQTDAAINPGNSGGPLLDEQGQLIGVNAQIRSEVRANSGVGFAIPVSALMIWACLRICAVPWCLRCCEDRLLTMQGCREAVGEQTRRIRTSVRRRQAGT